MRIHKKMYTGTHIHVYAHRSIHETIFKYIWGFQNSERKGPWVSAEQAKVLRGKRHLLGLHSTWKVRSRLDYTWLGQEGIGPKPWPGLWGAREALLYGSDGRLLCRPLGILLSSLHFPKPGPEASHLEVKQQEPGPDLFCSVEYTDLRTP